MRREKLENQKTEREVGKEEVGELGKRGRKVKGGKGKIERKREKMK